MELSRTINSDKRYYLDENTIENAASFLQTMRVFNDAKIDLYNAPPMIRNILCQDRLLIMRIRCF